MALEETSLANQFSNLGQEQNVAEESTVGNNVDLSNISSPTDFLNGYNIEKIDQQDQSFGNNVSTQNEAGNTPTTDTTTIRPKQGLSSADAMALYNQNVARGKEYANTIGTKFVEARNPALAYGNYEFDQYTSNVDRYRGYGKETFNKIGFNPLEENEDHFNANTSNWQDFKRMTGQFGTLFGSAFMSNYHSVYNAVTGKHSLLDEDEEYGRMYTKAMELGSSSKGGFSGAATNFALNMAYATGIGMNIYIEELGIQALGLALAPFTEGTSEVAALAAGAAEAEKGIRLLSIMKSAASTAFRGKEVGKISRGGWDILKTLGRAEDAKTFWTGVRAGAKTAGEGFVGFVNPFRQTVEAVNGIRRGQGAYRNLSNFAKVSKSFGGFYRDIRENMASIGESQLEGGNTYNELVKSNLEAWHKRPENEGKEPSANDLREIYSNAEAGGKLDTFINIPLIFLSNRVVFDGLFNFKGIKSLTEFSEMALANGKNATFDLGTKTFKQGATGLAGKLDNFKTAMKVFKNPKVYAGAFLNYTKENFVEGLQETGQDVSSGSIKNYYTSLYSNPTSGGNHLIKSSFYKSLGEDVFSAKGLETFASGFLMGGAMGPLGSAGKFLATGSKELYMKVASPKKYEQYVKQKALIKTQGVEALNNIMADADKLFSRRNESIVIQTNANNNMAQAKLNGDDKIFHDAKDEKTFDHIFTALDNGTYNKVIQAFEEIGKLSETDIADYFNLEEGTKAKEKVQEYIERAKQIKERYDVFQDKMPNPFNPMKFRKNTELRVNEFIAHKAFEDAKKIAIASEYGFERAIERMSSTFDEISKNSPLRTAMASDFTVLQNENSIKQEVNLLKQEIKSLQIDGTSADEKRLAKLKTTKLEALTDYLEHFKNYNQNKEGSTTSPDGKVTVPHNESLLNPLRDSFGRYIKAIAKMNNESTIFDTKVQDSFNKIVDYYNLNEDGKKYAEVVNHLSDPANLLRYAERAQQTMRDIFENRNQLIADSIDSYIGVHELNNLMVTLGGMSVVINPAEVEALYKDGKLPSSFFELKQNTIIDKNDAHYPAMTAIVELYSKLKRNASATDPIPEELQPEKTEEEKQQEAAAAAAQQPVVIPPAPAAPPGAIPPTSLPPMDAELERRLRIAYEQMLITGNPNTTFEEYVTNFGSAQRIKEEYAREKSTKKSTKVTKYTDAKTLEEKVAWIKANNPVLVRDIDDQTYVDDFEKRRNAILNDISTGKSKEDTLRANGYILANVRDINKEYSDLLQSYGINEPAAPAAPAGPAPKTKVEIAKETAQTLIDGVTSLRDLPSSDFSGGKEVGIKILEMIAEGNLKSIDVLNMLEIKQEQLAKNLTINDIEKGDFITFTDGRRAFVTTVSQDGTVQMKMVGSPKGQFDTMNISDIAKNIKMIEESKTVTVEPVEEEVEISSESKEAMEASKDVMSEFVNNTAELQKINEENEKSVGTDNSANENDLLNNLGCNTK
jgi:hypothetical protein